MSGEKRLRQYVDDIVVLNSKQARREALLTVPSELRSDVEYRVCDYFKRRADFKKYLAGVKQRGRYARQSSRPASDCPYQKTRGLFSEVWREGWHEADRKINQTLRREHECV